jgi:hypothetical protein
LNSIDWNQKGVEFGIKKCVLLSIYYPKHH